MLAELNPVSFTVSSVTGVLVAQNRIMLSLKPNEAPAVVFAVLPNTAVLV